MHPLSPSWLVLMSRRRLHVDSVDDELWGRFFTLAKGDGRAKLKSPLKVVDVEVSLAEPKLMLKQTSEAMVM